jgi:hypothetical protein
VSDAASGTIETVRDFLEDHAFALFPDGGLVMNLRNGSYSSLNASAAALLDLVGQAGRWEEAISLARDRWGLSEGQAAIALDDLRRTLVLAERAPTMALDYRYLPLEGGYALHHRSRPVLAVDRDARHVSLLVHPSELSVPLELCLRFVSPKILNALQRIVLHAAANQFGQSLVAISGVSGAGKSTTSRLLADVGVPKVADEFLVVSVRSGEVVAQLGAEAQMVRWCREAAQTLVAHPRERVSCSSLLHLDQGSPEVPVDRVLLLDRTRRRGSSIETESLSASQAIEHLVNVVFLGVSDRAGLRRFLADCRALSVCMRTELAHVPGDLVTLAQALRDYTVKTAS